MNDLFNLLSKNIINIAAAVLLFVAPGAFAQISGAHGSVDAYGRYICGDGVSRTYTANVTLIANFCTISGIQGYVPHSGNYKIRLYFLSSAYTVYGLADSTSAWFDQTKPINDQNVQVSGSNVHTNSGAGIGCYALVDEAGTIYTLDWNGANRASCVSHLPYPTPPPDPVPLPVSCSINNGNTLDVKLGTLDRSTLPTTPDAATQTTDIPVVCEGGVDVAVNMQLSYTPISVNGAQAVDTHAKGVGVAILYNGKALAPTDNTHIDLLTGSNTLSLGFEAVRDPSVNIGDIPTGEFHASAVLVMTQL